MPARGWAVWTLGFMVKPHPVIIVPVLLALTVRVSGWGALARSAVAAVVVAGAVLGPWVVHGDGANIATTYKALFDANYERLSASAWNVWWFRDVAAHPAPDDDVLASVPLVTYRMTGVALSALAGALAMLLVWRRPTVRTALLAAAYLAAAFFVLPVSTHERYLYPVVALLLPVAVLERRWMWLYGALSATLFLNMVAVAPPVRSLSGRWVESPFSLAVAALNVALFGAWTLVLVGSLIRDTRRSRPAPLAYSERSMRERAGAG